MARRGGDSIVIIAWRDIPAQVNGRVGDARHQVILPQVFHTAIDRAAMVADKKTAGDYVAEWRRTAIPLTAGADLASATQAEADRLEELFGTVRLDAFVAAGGWDPDRAEHERV